MRRLFFSTLLVMSFLFIVAFPSGSIGKWDDHHAIFESVLASQKKQIAVCESGERHYGVWGDNHRAYGKYQFHKATFDRLKIKYSYPQLRWESLKDQEWLFDKAIRNGDAGEWTCARCLHAKIGRYAAFKIKAINIASVSCKTCKFQTASWDKDKNKIKAKKILGL